MAATLKRQSSNSGSDEDDDGVACPLSGAEALAACKQFAAATDTNTGLGMMMLQKNGWDVQQAISAYQNSTVGQSKAVRKPTKPKKTSPFVALSRGRTKGSA